MKNVLLIGIGGVYNYGCEAIVRGTVDILKAYNDRIQISYVSYNYADDIKRLVNCDINIIERKRAGRWHWRNILRKLLSLFNISYSLPYDSTDWLDGYDTVFSIGGDIYTLNSDGHYNQSLPLFLEKCQAKGMKYVLWGASVGKFENNPEALRFYTKHLKKIDLIVARENVTVDYLNTLGVIDNVVFAPDPAFFVEYDDSNIKKNNSKMVLGVNLSPLSSLYKYRNLDKAVSMQSNAIYKLAKKLNCKILLLPHVISPDINDNDLSFMERMAQMISDKGCDVDIVRNDPGFIGIKRDITKCDFVVAARMHCAINAITMNVPTLFLSYSDKAVGMANMVYGDSKAVIPLHDLEDYDRVADIIKNWNCKSLVSALKSYKYKTVLSKI